MKTPYASSILTTLLLVCMLLVTGCTIPTQSSGFNYTAPQLPPGIPKRVTVKVYGPSPLASQAANEFAEGLMTMGFDVVDQDPEAVFEGSLTAERSREWVNTHLDLRLVKDSKAIWFVQAHDPRAIGSDMAVETSIVYTTRAALNALRKDLGQPVAETPVAHSPKRYGAN